MLFFTEYKESLREWMPQLYRRKRYIACGDIFISLRAYFYGPFLTDIRAFLTLWPLKFHDEQEKRLHEKRHN